MSRGLLRSRAYLPIWESTCLIPLPLFLFFFSITILSTTLVFIILLFSFAIFTTPNEYKQLSEKLWAGLLVGAEGNFFRFEPILFFTGFGLTFKDLHVVLCDCDIHDYLNSGARVC